MTAIASLTLNKFRGVADELTLSFVRNGKPASVLFLGDNGSGKSSIIDAIEFCLQGLIYRKSFDDPSAPTLRNLYASDEGPSICSVRLDDGREISRSTRPGDRHHFDNPAVEDFGYSGFVLRRRDLLRFTEASDRERSTILVSFIARWDKGNWLELTPRGIDLRQAIQSQQQRRRAVEDELVSLLNEDPDHFPRSQAGLEEYVTKLRGGHAKMTKIERRAYLRCLLALPAKSRRSANFMSRSGL